MQDAGVTARTVGYAGSHLAEQLRNRILVLQITENDAARMGSILFRFGYQRLYKLPERFCLSNGRLYPLVENQGTCHVRHQRFAVTCLTTKMVDFLIVSHNYVSVKKFPSSRRAGDKNCERHFGPNPYRVYTV